MFMIINNVNGREGHVARVTWEQTGSGSTEKKQGLLDSGQYTAPFQPVGTAPFTVVITASPGFVVNGIKSADEMITFYSSDGKALPLLTSKAP
jgi:hypothetical protein